MFSFLFKRNKNNNSYKDSIGIEKKNSNPSLNESEQKIDPLSLLSTSNPSITNSCDTNSSSGDSFTTLPPTPSITLNNSNLSVDSSLVENKNSVSNIGTDKWEDENDNTSQNISIASFSKSDANNLSESTLSMHSNNNENSGSSILLQLENDIEFIDESEIEGDDSGYCFGESNNKRVNKLSLNSACCQTEPEFQNEKADQEEKGVECHIISERELSEAEKKAMVQLDDIRSQLLTKESEMNFLQALNMLSADRDIKIRELEGLTLQIRRLREENETSISTVKKVERKLDELILRNQELVGELREKQESLESLERSKEKNDQLIYELRNRIKDLEAKLKALNIEKQQLIDEHEAVEIERDEESRAMQNALDDALEAKIKIQTKFEHEFELFRTTCSKQEEQLMDDFEWKLRQIESNCKSKLVEKDKQHEEKLKEVRSLVESELKEEKEKLVQEKRNVDEQMRQVCHYKAYEIELVQLRGLVHEQQRALRSAARQMEHFKYNEILFHDELRNSRVLIEQERNNVKALQSRRREVEEDSLNSKLDKQKNDLNAKWEEKMRTECARLCKLYAEEKHLAVETIKLQKDQEICSCKQIWDRQKSDLLQSISKLQDILAEKESYYQSEIDKITTKFDRENWELRRKIDKLCTSHDEQMSRLEDRHNKEIETLNTKYQNLSDQLKESEHKLQELQEKERLNKEYENDNSGKLTPTTSFSCAIMNKSDSGCGYDSSSDGETQEVDEDDEDVDAESIEESEEDEHLTPESISKLNQACPDIQIHHLTEEIAVHNLREEVATLQGSIEKLTSDLTTIPKLNVNSTSNEEENDDDEDAEEEESSESEDESEEEEESSESENEG